MTTVTWSVLAGETVVALIAATWAAVWARRRWTRTGRDPVRRRTGHDVDGSATVDDQAARPATASVSPDPSGPAAVRSGTAA